MERILAAAKSGDWETAYRLFQDAGLEDSGYGHSEAVDHVISCYENSTRAEVAAVCIELAARHDMNDDDEVLFVLGDAANLAAYRSALAAVRAEAVTDGAFAVGQFARGSMDCTDAGLEFGDEETATAYCVLGNAGNDGTESSYWAVVPGAAASTGGQ